MATTWVHRLQGRGLGWYASLASRTARYQTVGAEYFEPTSTDQSRIIAAWHGLTMMMTGYLAAHRDPSRFVLIVPDDPRGVVLSQWARGWGAETFAISMQEDSFVAARRLLALIRKLRPRTDRPQAGAKAPLGKYLYVNPDGPDGPSHRPKDGVLFIARKAGTPIVPTAAYTATAFRIPRWDRYVVPLPYSRIAVAAGEPYVVPPRGSLDRAREELRERLNDVERRAEALYRAGGS
jgi:lysophospholipid acyltransferase (LPLAT)-like uncharacterized protein